MRSFLVSQMRKTKQIKKMLMITKKGQIIDIFGLIWYIKSNRSPARRRRCLPLGLLFYLKQILPYRARIDGLIFL